MRPTPTIFLLYVARGVRGFADGFATIILPAYLSAIGYDPIGIGVVVTASLLGTAIFTLAIGAIAPRHDLRTLMMIGALLMALTGLAFPNFEHITVVALVAFAGTINPSTGDLGVLVPLEHAMLARGVSNEERTQTFARYSLVGALSMAAGSLAAAAPDFIAQAGFERLSGYKLMFYAYTALGIVCVMLYRRLPHVLMTEAAAHAPLGPSRGVVYRLAALFSLDAFAGGFVVQSLMALWLFERFDLSVSAASVFFFWSSTLSAFSYPVAATAFAAHRSRQHHGLHPHSVQRVSNPGGVLPQSLPDARPAAAAVGVIANGCAYPYLLRDGGGDAGRTAGSSKRHRGTAQPRFGNQPGLGRRAAGWLVFRIAAHLVRHAEDSLRPWPSVLVSAHQAARRTGRNDAHKTARETDVNWITREHVKVDRAAIASRKFIAAARR